MICPNCGNKNKTDVKFCSKCGKKLITKDNDDFFDVEKTNCSQKKSKKKLWIGICSIVILFIVLITVVFYLPLKSTTTNFEKSSILYNGSDEYYLSGYGAFLLGDDGSVSQVKSNYDSSDEDSNLSVDINKSVFDGKILFAQENGTTTELYKFKVDGNDTVKKEVWVDENTLINSVVVTEKNNSISQKRYTGNMQYWQLDGNYIYFIYLPGIEYINNEQNIAYHLGRINIDGTNIEFVNNEIASTYAIKDGWIYYYDNGYTYDESTSDGYYYDYDRAGIYRMKTDGSQKELLYDDFETDENDTRTKITYCDRMNVYGDYIYFIDYSKNGKSRVCRMKIDGSGLECVSQNGAYSYTVDTENNKLYYSSGIFGLTQIEPKTIYEVDISNKIESELFKYGRFNQPEFYVYNDYLYFTSSQFLPGNSAESPGVCGMRYNLNNKTMQSLYGYTESNFEFNEYGIIDHTVVTSDYYWDKAKCYSGCY